MDEYAIPWAKYYIIFADLGMFDQESFYFEGTTHKAEKNGLESRRELEHPPLCPLNLHNMHFFLDKHTDFS